MMRNRTMTPPARRRPTLNFDLLECRQMLNASPITQQHTFVLEQQAFLRTIFQEVRQAMALARATNPSSTVNAGSPMAADPQLSLIAMKPASAGAGPLVSGFG